VRAPLTNSSLFPFPSPSILFENAVDGSSESEQRSTERVGKILNEEEIEGMRIVCRVRFFVVFSRRLPLPTFFFPHSPHILNRSLPLPSLRDPRCLRIPSSCPLSPLSSPEKSSTSPLPPSDQALRLSRSTLSSTRSASSGIRTPPRSTSASFSLPFFLSAFLP
jgi:hypothetical protein